MNEEYKKVLNRYQGRTEGLDRQEFYKFARGEGVNRGHSFALLRDLFNFNLTECFEVMFACDDDPSRSSN
jgi:hypothetical protein